MLYRRKRLAERLLKPIVAPAVLLSGAAMAFVGGYNTTRANLHCQEIAADLHYERAYVVPNQVGSHDCICQGKRDPDGNLDTTASESVPLL